MAIYNGYTMGFSFRISDETYIENGNARLRRKIKW